MAKAIETIRNGTMGLKKTCKEFNVPRTTLQRRARMLGDSSISAKKGLGSRKPVFSEAMENELVRHVKDMESMLFGFSPSQLRKVAYQYAEANEIDHPFSQEEKAAGIDWLKGFMSRHQKSLSLRTPEPTSAARAPDVPQPVTGPVVPQPVTGPVVPQPADGPVDVPTINIRVVSPLPKVTSSVRRKTSRSGKTCIITSSPYKRNLELEKTKGPSSKEVKKNAPRKVSLLPRNQRKFGQLQKNMGLHQAQVELRRLLPKGKAQTQMLNVCIVTRSSLIVSPAKFGFNAHSARNGPTRIVPGMRSETLNVKCVPKS